MPRVLITGGSGFLGSHVAAALAARDDVELVVCGDLRHGVPRDGIIDETLDVTDSARLAPLLRRHQAPSGQPERRVARSRIRSRSVADPA